MENRIIFTCTYTHTSSTLRPSHTQENCVTYENISSQKHSQTCTPSYLTCTCQCLKRGDDRQIISLVRIVKQFEVRQVKTWTSSNRQRERGGGGQPLDLESKKNQKHYKRVMHGGYLPQKHKPPDKHARLVSRPSTAKVDPSGTRKSFIFKGVNQIVIFLKPPHS